MTSYIIHAITFLVVILQRPALAINETTGIISWTSTPQSTVDSDDTHIVYSQITGYTIQISGGNCLKDDPITISTTSTEFLLQSDSECQDLSDTGTRIHSGANYSVRVKSLNHHTNTESNFSNPEFVSTQAKGIGTVHIVYST